MRRVARLLLSWWKEERRTPLEQSQVWRNISISILVIAPLIIVHLRARVGETLHQQRTSRDDKIALMETAFASTNRIARDWGQWDDAYRFEIGRAHV